MKVGNAVVEFQAVDNFSEPLNPGINFLPSRPGFFCCSDVLVSLCEKLFSLVMETAPWCMADYM